MSSEEATNPCIYKKECKQCQICDNNTIDRPKLCIEMECEYYTPCKKCGVNKTLAADRKCGNCSRRKNNKLLVRGADGEPIEIDDNPPTNKQLNPYHLTSPVSSGNSDESLTPSIHDPLDSQPATREIEITVPGKPPNQFSQSEKDYYNNQWLLYKDFYSDPTAWPVVHQVIIMEIELIWLGTAMLSKRGESLTNYEAQRSKLINNLESLKKQLPTKESQQLTDDEKSMAAIYSKYLEEKAAREISGTRIIFSPEAMALAPMLPYPIDLREIINRLGYDTTSAIELCNKFKSMPSDAHKLLEYLGFDLHEKLAMDAHNPDLEDLGLLGIETIEDER